MAEHHDVRALEMEAKASGLVAAFVAAYFSGEERYRGRSAEVTDGKALGCATPTPVPTSKEEGCSR
jgi:hypothetical protein